MVKGEAMRLVIDDGLSFELFGLHPLLKSAIRQRLPYFLDREPGPGSARISIGNDPPRESFHFDHKGPLLQMDQLRIYRQRQALLFEVPGILGWCCPEKGLAAIRANQPTSVMAHAFVNLALGSMLIELALPFERYAVHAAAIALEGRGILLPGPSGCGKSTIYRHAEGSGFQLLSDDLVWLWPGEQGIRLLPFPHPSDGRPCRPTTSSASLDFMVFPEIGKPESSRIAPLELRPALDILLRQSGFLTDGPLAGKRFRAMVRAAASVPRYELLAGADPGKTSKLLKRLLQGNSADRDALTPRSGL